MKKKLLSYEELKQKAKEIISKKRTKDDYLNAFKYYDIDPLINKEYLNLLFKINDSTMKNEFDRLMYTLEYKDMIELGKTLNEQFNKKNSQIIFYNLLILLLDDKINFQQFQNFFESEIDNILRNKGLRIPFIEGNEQYFYFGLIKEFKFYFCNLKNHPNDKDIDKESYRYYCSSNFAHNFPNMNPSNFITESKAQKIKDCGDNKINTNNFNENQREEKIEENIQYDYEYIFNKKIGMLKPFIEKYISEEFQIKMKELINSIPNRNIKKFYEIFLLHILISYCQYNLMNQNLLKKSEKIFYEEMEFKIVVIKYFLRTNKKVKIYEYKTNQELSLDNIKNIDYVINYGNDKITINFYDFILSNDLFALKKDEINKCLNNMDNWTLQKYAKENSLFFSKNISNIIENNIYNSIINNTVLKRVFSETIPFNDYEYPFSNNKIINQLKRAIFIFPFCNYSLSGLTLKTFGITLINNRVKPIEFELDIKDWFYYILLKGMLFKVVYIHEFNFHYTFILIFYNNYSDSLITPKKLFKRYKVIEGDAGTKGECLIFGNQINFIFIKAALYISDDNKWNIGNEEFEEFAKIFLSLNMPSNEDINLDSLLKNGNQFIINLYNSIIKEIIIFNEKGDKNKKKKKDYGNYMVSGYIKNNCDELVEKLSYGQMYLLK